MKGPVDYIKGLLKKIDVGEIVIGVVLILVIITVMSFVSALVGGDISRFPRILFATGGFLLVVVPLIVVIFILPLLIVWGAVDLLVLKSELVLEGAQWIKHRPGRIKALRFVVKTSAMLLCFVVGFFLLGRAQHTRDDWESFMWGLPAIFLLYIGLQIFALAFNAFVGRMAGRLWAAFRRE